MANHGVPKIDSAVRNSIKSTSFCNAMTTTTALAGQRENETVILVVVRACGGKGIG
jgi:hypothetical protein